MWWVPHFVRDDSAFTLVLIRSDRALNRVRDSVGLLVDLVQFAAFDEQTDLWFGAGIAQEDAAFAGELALDFVAQFHDFAQFFDRRLRFHVQIALRLRIFFQTGFQFAQRLAGRVHDAQNLQRADDAVAGGGEIAEDDVAALFAAEIEISRDHFFDDVTVADFRANDFAAMRGERFIETEIAHDRGDERVLLQPAGAQKIDRGDGENLVAIDNLAVFVAKQNAIGVAIVSDADMRAALFDDALNFLRDECCRIAR